MSKTPGWLLPNKIVPAEWTRQASCRWVGDPDIFFSEDPRDVDRARAVCRRCPVRAECAADFWADRFAVVAGFTPDERKSVDRLSIPAVW